MSVEKLRPGSGFKSKSLHKQAKATLMHSSLVPIERHASASKLLSTDEYVISGIGVSDVQTKSVPALFDGKSDRIAEKFPKKQYRSFRKKPTLKAALPKKSGEFQPEASKNYDEIGQTNLNVKTIEITSDQLLPNPGVSYDLTSSVTDELPSTVGPKPNGYKPIPLQSEILNVIKPPKDEKRTYLGPGFVVSQAYRVDKRIDRNILDAVVQKVTKEHPVLNTIFYRNERILDADLECILGELTPNIEFADIDSERNQQLNMEIVIMYGEAWFKKINLEHPFGILVLQKDINETYLIFASSLAVCDSLSLTWCSLKILETYQFVSTQVANSMRLDQALLDYGNNSETEPFEEVSFEFRTSTVDMGYWKNQVMDRIIEKVDLEDRIKFEAELKKLKTEKGGICTALESLAKKKDTLELELGKLKSQRQEIDNNEYQVDRPSYYVDPYTNERIEISHGVKVALIRAVLGDEAANDNISALLDKHEVSLEVKIKIKAEKMTLESFSSLTESQVDNIGLSSKEKRKILALSDYVRNRIKECILEQTKVKFGLERRILRLKRDLDQTLELLKITQDNLDSNDDLSIRLHHILNPQGQEKPIEPLQLKAVYDVLEARLSTISTEKYAIEKFTISEDISDNLRRFRSNWAASIRNKKMKSKRFEETSDIDSLLGSESDFSDSEGNEIIESNRWIKEKTVNVVCLAAFTVLLKHITGIDKFMIGITHSYRTNGQIVGPYSDNLPARADLSSKGLTFDQLFAFLFKVFHYSKRYGKGYPSMRISRELSVVTDMPVRFEYYTNPERIEWLRNGFTLDDILYETPTDKKFGSLTAERLWSHNEQDSYDLKIILVENENTIEGAIRYRKDHFDSSKISKWVGKYLSTLENIDPSRRITVSTLISK